MAPYDKETHNVGGLFVRVYSTSSENKSKLNAESKVEVKKPVFILFFLHGRTRNAEHLEQFIEVIYKDATITSGLAKELLVVTFDHRNHGSRMVDPKGNAGWSKDKNISNEKHAIDMYAMHEIKEFLMIFGIEGSARDVSWLIDFLPMYLFPESERRIAGWGIAGISLGGHSTWLSLAKEPRIQVGIPIIGCPDYLSLMSARAAEYGIPIPSKYFPESLLALVRAQGPPSTPYLLDNSSNPFWEKKILVLSGGADPLVPWDASKKFVEELVVGQKGVKKVFVQPNTGHTCSMKMVEEMIEFLHLYILRNEESEAPKL